MNLNLIMASIRTWLDRAWHLIAPYWLSKEEKRVWEERKALARMGHLRLKGYQQSEGHLKALRAHYDKVLEKGNLVRVIVPEDFPGAFLTEWSVWEKMEKLKCSTLAMDEDVCLPVRGPGGSSGSVVIKKGTSVGPSAVSSVVAKVLNSLPETKLYQDGDIMMFLGWVKAKLTIPEDLRGKVSEWADQPVWLHGDRKLVGWITPDQFEVIQNKGTGK